MYAVIQSGGKQYRVAVGDKLKVETLKVEEGDSIDLDHVLMIADGEKLQIGTPVLDTVVKARVLGHGRGDKIKILKLRRRKNSRTHRGHRQNFTELEITGIGGKKKAAPKAPAEAKAAPAKEEAKKPEAKKSAAKTEKIKAEKIKEAPKKAEKTTASDDLTQLKGVGPVIAKKLAGLGITGLQQVAEFTPEDVERVDAELNFKGRIDREDWIGQAKELLKG
jgi:large subunit ribosomal protein L21